ncbi:hypothetical protein VPHK391_0082 [Vibrio phage K391]
MNKSSNGIEIKKGSVIREYKYGMCLESTVITDPFVNDRGQLEFDAKTKRGVIVEYMKHASSLEVAV